MGHSCEIDFLYIELEHLENSIKWMKNNNPQ